MAESHPAWARARWDTDIPIPALKAGAQGSKSSITFLEEDRGPQAPQTGGEGARQDPPQNWGKRDEEGHDASPWSPSAPRLGVPPALVTLPPSSSQPRGPAASGMQGSAENTVPEEINKAANEVICIAISRQDLQCI